MQKYLSYSRQTAVLIVGAGPTGLTLACELARRGVNIRIIDRVTEYQFGSRAKGLQPRSREIMNDLGLGDEIDTSGSTHVIFRRYNGNELLGDILPEIFVRNDTKYSGGIMLPQWKIEELLRMKLKTYGVEVELAKELIDFTQDENLVSAKIQSPTGVETTECKYIVGCDGGKSKVRKLLGIKFEGETHEEERALIGDVEIEGLQPDAWHIWMHPTLGFGFSLCPFKCTTAWQLQTIALPDGNGELPEPDLETFQRLFAERTNMEGVTLKNASWASTYRVNIRMAERFRSGRIFLAGDAAHVHSIAGGLGMNTGIQDAYNLGWKLALSFKHETQDTLLDTYEEERLPIAAWTLNISSERHRVVMDNIRNRGDGGLHTLSTKDTTQLNLHYRYSSLSINLSNEETVVKAGDRAPDSILPDGTWLSDVYRGTHFTVLYGKPAVAGQKWTIFGDEHLRSFIVPEHVMHLFGNRDVVFVVRPDGYVGMIANASDDHAIFNYLSSYLQHEAKR